MSNIPLNKPKYTTETKRKENKRNREYQNLHVASRYRTEYMNDGKINLLSIICRLESISHPQSKELCRAER